MWKRAGKGSAANRPRFSIVHQYIQHFNEVSGSKSAYIRKRSKIPGVLITQYVVNIPDGQSTPDFQRAPNPITATEGKLAVFKAKVTGDPKPEVSWKRIKGSVSDEDKFQSKYNKSTGECILEIHNVSAAEMDMYKCCAVNEFGKAVCAAALTVTDASADPSHFRRLLRKSKVEDNQATQADRESEAFWEVMLNADSKDYERICSEFGVDKDLMLKKLEMKRRERAQNKSTGGREGELQAVENLRRKKGTLSDDISCQKEGLPGTPVPDGGIQYERDAIKKQSHVSAARSLTQNDTALIQIDGEDENLLPVEFIMSNVDFVIKIEEVQAEEREDALFECVLTHPVPRVTWKSKASVLEDGDKYSISISDHKLVHRLLIKDCMLEDKSIYSAVVGKASCSAWLVVEADSDPLSAGNVKARKTTVAGGARIDLEKVAQQQLIKIQEQREESSASLKAKQEGQLPNSERDGEGNAVSGTSKSKKAGCDPKRKKHSRSGQADFNKVTDTDEEGEYSDESEDFTGSDQNDVTAMGNNSGPDGRKRHKRKVKRKKGTSDPNEPASDSEGNQNSANGESLNDHDDCDATENATGSSKHSKRKRQGPLIEDMVIDPGAQFICGLSDVSAVINETAELTCKLNSEDCEGVWYRDGKKISPDDNFTIVKEGAVHKLLIIGCKEEHAGKYRFEADGRKTVAMFTVKDPPRIHPEDLSAFTEPVTVKVGQNAIFKMQFVGHEPIKIQWYKEGDELQDDNNTKIEKSGSHSRLLLGRCQRKDTGEIKIKLKNEDGFKEAISQLIVLDKPTSPLGPAEVTESSAVCIEFKWRPPKDDGGSPVINYMIERQQVGRNTWRKLGEIPGAPIYRDTDVDHGRKYCYRIRAVTAEGTSEVMETGEMQAGTLAFPGPPAPPKVVSTHDDRINVCWESPSNRGGSRILGYILEKRKKGSNLWIVVNAMDELIKEKKYTVSDVVAGMEYEFRVTAINFSGAGEFSSPSEFVFARDPKKPPGKVTGLKVTETSYIHLVLTWTKPEDKPGIQDEATGYFAEIRQAESLEWSRCSVTPIITTSFSVKSLKPMDMYWVRVIATNDGGEGPPEELPNYVLAMPSPVRPKFTNHKMKTFMVVRAGNTVRITANFEASPLPNIMWIKDNVPVAKRATVSNSDGSSQLLIPSSERSDSGIYSVLVKNLAGQDTFSTEVRVTDDPKPPGPVELEENVPGTVTVMWEPSPDEKRDDRLHYTVSKLDSTKRTWTTVADRLFNNKFTVCNIMHGRQYNFRVYAKNDMGVSAPSESPAWGVEKKKEKFAVNAPTRKDCDLRCAPTFIVPLKLHTAPKGYECYMSCAVKGSPKPRVTWFRNHTSINTNANYYISNTCGVCSMLILHVGPRDMGEYTISAENALGRVECSTVLSVRE